MRQRKQNENESTGSLLTMVVLIILMCAMSLWMATKTEAAYTMEWLTLKYDVWSEESFNHNLRCNVDQTKCYVPYNFRGKVYKIPVANSFETMISLEYFYAINLIDPSHKLLPSVELNILLIKKWYKPIW